MTQRARSVGPAGLVVPPALGRRIGAFDRTTDRAFDRLRGRPLVDRVLYGASALGDHSLLWHLVGVGRALRAERHEQASLRLAVALGVESLVVNWGIKSLFRRARPTLLHVRPRALRQPRTSSFPSGHATSGFLAASLLTDADRRLAPAWYALAAVVAASRVHVRIHHASDVVAGAAIGLVFAEVTRRLWPVVPTERNIPVASSG